MNNQLGGMLSWLDHQAQRIIMISSTMSNLAAGDHWHSPGTDNGTNIV